MTKVLAAIFAITGAIKNIASIVTNLKAMYDKYIEGRIHAHYEKKRKVVDKVTAEVEAEQRKPTEEQDDEKLKDLHRKLTNLGKH